MNSRLEIKKFLTGIVYATALPTGSSSFAFSIVLLLLLHCQHALLGNHFGYYFFKNLCFSKLKISYKNTGFLFETKFSVDLKKWLLIICFYGQNMSFNSNFPRHLKRNALTVPLFSLLLFLICHLTFFFSQNHKSAF